MNQRPGGITVIAIVYLVLGVLSLLWSGLIFGVSGIGSLFSGLFGAENLAAVSNTGAWSGFLGILAAAVQIAVGFGLLAMKKWAWILALIGVGLTVIQGVISLFGGGLFAFLCGALWLVIPVIILVYLLSPKIRAAFEV